MIDKAKAGRKLEPCFDNCKMLYSTWKQVYYDPIFVRISISEMGAH